MMRTDNLVAIALTLALALSPAAIQQAVAQSSDTIPADTQPAVADPVAAPAEPATFVQLRRTIRTATEPTALADAVAAMTELAKTGDLPSAQFLAQEYAGDAGAIPADQEQAIAFLTIAADLGDATSRATLIKALKASDDPAQKLAALDYLQQAFDAGDTSGAADLAKIYRTGSLGNDVDIPKAITIYQAMAEAGDADSVKQLYSLYRAGTGGADDEAMALRYLTMMAEAGDANALEQVAKTYQTGTGVEVDLAKAEDYFRRSSELGNARATLALASGLTNQTFGPGREAETFTLLEAAVKQEVPGAATMLANAYFNGAGIAASSDKAIAILKEAVTYGDDSAITSLLSVYVRGKGRSVPSNIAAAEALYASVTEAQMSAAIQSFGVAIAGASARSVADYATMMDRMAPLDNASKVAAGTLLRGLNANAYVYMVQSALHDGGLLTSAPSGTLTSATITAINSFCNAKEISASCRFGPLDRRSWDAMGPLLYAD